MRVLRINPLRRRGGKRLLLYLAVAALVLTVARLALQHARPGGAASLVQLMHGRILVISERADLTPSPLGPSTALPAVLAASDSGSKSERSLSVLPAKCAENKFLANSQCRPCHAQCVSCYGYGDELCLDCRHGKDGSRCVGKCPRSRPYTGGESGKWCVVKCAGNQVPDLENKCRKKDEVTTPLATKTDSKLGWRFDPSVKLDFPESALTTYQPLSSLQSSRFLLPLLPYGPNNQYRGFKESIIAAMYLHRTLVLPPFFNHYSVSLPGHMPAAKRQFAERFLMTPQETFDIDILAEAISVASWKQFEETCQGQVAVEYHCRADHEMSVERSFYFYRATKLNAEHAEKIYIYDKVKDWPNTPAQQLVEAAFSTSHRCAVLAFPYRTLQLTGSHLAYLSKHVQRPVLTRQVASVVWQSLLHGQRYVAVHWRFNSEWGRAWCKQTNAFQYNVSQVPHNMIPECRVLAATNVRVLQVLQSVMAKHHISRVYMAVIGDSKGLVKLLARHIKHLILASHIKAKVDISSNYALSLAEQELCAGSEIFIGSTKSSWSHNVMDERYGAGKQTPVQNQWWHVLL